MGRETSQKDDGQTRGRLVGRESELSVVADFIDVRPVVSPVALVIEGEAGIGKSTVVRAALERAASMGVRVFTARPAAGEIELPYLGLGDLLATASADALGTLGVSQRNAIEAALGREGSSAAVDEYALARGVLELLRFEGAAGDLLLVVDDVQWLDRPTVSALSFGLRRLAPVPIRVLIARRTEEGSALDMPLGLADWGDARRLTIGPLSATELGGMLRLHMSKQFARPYLEKLHGASRGNPMFALELARRSPGEVASPAATLSLAVKERVSTLDDRARAALSFAAAALSPSTDLLLRAGVEREDLKFALETGIIRANGEHLSFAHPTLSAAAYELLLPDERREIHARLAAASTDIVERGHHISRSARGPDESAAVSLDRAAESAASLGDHAGAAAFLLRAAELSLDPAGTAAQARQIRAAAELELAGDVKAAASLARNLVERLPSGVMRARARRTFVSCTLGSEASFESGLEALALALEDAEGDGEFMAELHVAMGDISIGAGRFEEASAHARVAIDLAERSGEKATAVAALATLGEAESLLGQGVSEAARLAFARWDGTIFSAGQLSPRMALAYAHEDVGAFAEAGELFKRELAMAEERGLEAIEVVARSCLARTQRRLGRWPEALANARLAVEHARQAAGAQNVYVVSCELATMEALLGRHREARALATQAQSEAAATADFFFNVHCRAALGLVALAEDDPQEAVAVLGPAWEMLRERGLAGLSSNLVVPILGEALVAVGRHDDAMGVAEAVRASPLRTQPWCRVMASRCIALVDSARGDHDSGRASIAAALEAHDDIPEPFEHARSLHLSGRIERSARNWGAARAAFVDALERFDALGAARWAEKAAADIARLPGRRPGDKQDLTTREREIAELVAAGFANKEIASRLFLSLRTIEANLSKVYAKLGVRSRTELASRLGRPDGRE